MHEPMFDFTGTRKFAQPETVRQQPPRAAATPRSVGTSRSR
ncbi:hypothetical protein [Pacificimonas flava]|uniref:Uncharacterized protein n=1 Tax=Pacificimonas flava TaxID=1234595 RepID=M2U4U4_9SPHN|nr:hypothetical protein [Pacificimonas flava]EMD83008.1 hypothetical protein C725_1606 [Pacificimonas flava]MBB5280167.1 hypothetical protein [Pacificimonas flava]